MEKKSSANGKTASLFGMHNLNWSNIIPMGSSSPACLRKKKYDGNKFNLYQEEFHIITNVKIIALNKGLWVSKIVVYSRVRESLLYKQKKRGKKTIYVY
jgi:hypothetical protein